MDAAIPECHLRGDSAAEGSLADGDDAVRCSYYSII
jgi:hypothetical protein